jgi:lipopolysaccharide assembly outer membrane protein LptD (OstA)
MPFTRRCLLPALGLVAILLLHAPARSDENAFEISMDDLVDDRGNGQVIARGNVEIRFFGAVLLADEVVYDRQQRKLSARGNVSFTAEDGTVTRAAAVNLNDDTRDAFVAYARRQKVRIDR